MLEELTIQNYALIDQASVSFTRGLNILSGETGAGKSILIGALGLILGTRADIQSIRTARRRLLCPLSYGWRETPRPSLGLIAMISCMKTVR
jgi:DNA repair ATPase RecN